MKTPAMILVTLWGVAMVYVGGVTMARHTAVFQSGEKLVQGSRQVGTEILKNPSLDHEKPYIALHLLDERCTCSRAVLEDIQKRVVSDTVSVVLTTSEPRPETRRGLEAKGIVVRRLDPQEAKTQFGLETVPWLVVLDRRMNILYSGGYSDTKVRGRKDIRLGELMNEIRHDRRPASLPTYGCVTSEKLRTLLLEF